MKDRTEFNHLFYWFPMPGFWHSSSERGVIIFPPSSATEEHWMVIVPSQRQELSIQGENAENRAFRVAVEYVHRKDR